MKTLQCYDCDQSFEADTREEMLNLFYNHYMTEHNEIITGADEGEKKRWMERFDADWSTSTEK